MRIDIRTNLPDVAGRVAALGRQGPFVLAVSMTRSIKDGQAAIRAEQQRVFDRPTTYSLNGTFIKAATKSNLEARVWVKDNVASKGTPADRFLSPEIFGGNRSQKGTERLLQRSGLLPAGWYAVPAAAAQLDSFGNMKRSQLVQVLSQVKVQRGAGYESRASDSTRSKRTVARQGVSYFVQLTKRGKLKPGIYMKRQFFHGSAIKPVFLFVRAVAYRQRLKFFDVATKAFNTKFPGHFNEEMAKAIVAQRLR
jgi:hypothetical protein